MSFARDSASVRSSNSRTSRSTASRYTGPTGVKSDPYNSSAGTERASQSKPSLRMENSVSDSTVRTSPPNSRNYGVNRNPPILRTSSGGGKSDDGKPGDSFAAARSITGASHLINASNNASSTSSVGNNKIMGNIILGQKKDSIRGTTGGVAAAMAKFGGTAKSVQSASAAVGNSVVRQDLSRNSTNLSEQQQKQAPYYVQQPSSSTSTVTAAVPVTAAINGGSSLPKTKLLSPKVYVGPTARPALTRITSARSIGNSVAGMSANSSSRGSAAHKNPTERDSSGSTPGTVPPRVLYKNRSSANMAATTTSTAKLSNLASSSNNRNNNNNNNNSSSGGYTVSEDMMSGVVRQDRRGKSPVVSSSSSPSSPSSQPPPATTLAPPSSKMKRPTSNERLMASDLLNSSSNQSSKSMSRDLGKARNSRGVSDATNDLLDRVKRDLRDNAASEHIKKSIMQSHQPGSSNNSRIGPTAAAVGSVSSSSAAAAAAVNFPPTPPPSSSQPPTLYQQHNLDNELPQQSQSLLAQAQPDTRTQLLQWQREMDLPENAPIPPVLSTSGAQSASTSNISTYIPSQQPPIPSHAHTQASVHILSSSSHQVRSQQKPLKAPDRQLASTSRTSQQQVNNNQTAVDISNDNAREPLTVDDARWDGGSAGSGKREQGVDGGNRAGARGGGVDGGESSIKSLPSGSGSMFIDPESDDIARPSPIHMKPSSPSGDNSVPFEIHDPSVPKLLAEKDVKEAEQRRANAMVRIQSQDWQTMLSSVRGHSEKESFVSPGHLKTARSIAHLGQSRSAMGTLKGLKEEEEEEEEKGIECKEGTPSAVAVGKNTAMSLSMSKKSAAATASSSRPRLNRSVASAPLSYSIIDRHRHLQEEEEEEEEQQEQEEEEEEEEEKRKRVEAVEKENKMNIREIDDDLKDSSSSREHKSDDEDDDFGEVTATGSRRVYQELRNMNPNSMSRGNSGSPSSGSFSRMNSTSTSNASPRIQAPSQTTPRQQKSVTFNKNPLKSTSPAAKIASSSHVLCITTLRGPGEKDTIVLTGGEDHMLTVWSLETGQQIVRLSGHAHTIMSVVGYGGVEHMKNGDVGCPPLAVTASLDGSIRIWRVQECFDVAEEFCPHVSNNVQRSCLRFTEASNDVTSVVAITGPFGESILVSGGSLGINVRGLPQGTLLYRLRSQEHPAKILCMCSTTVVKSADLLRKGNEQYALLGPIVVTGCEKGNLNVWKINASKEIDKEKLRTHPDVVMREKHGAPSVQAISCFLAGGKVFVASAHARECNIRVWGLSGKQKFLIKGNPNPVCWILSHGAHDMNQVFLLFGDASDKITMWKIASGEYTATSYDIPDGRYALAAIDSNTERDDDLMLVSAPVIKKNSAGSVNNSNDSSYANNMLTRKWMHEEDLVVFSGCADSVVSGMNIYLDGKETATMVVGFAKGQIRVWSVAQTPGYRVRKVCSNDKEVTTRLLWSDTPHDAAVKKIIFFTDCSTTDYRGCNTLYHKSLHSTLLITSTVSGYIRVTDLPTGQHVLWAKKAHTQSISAMCCYPDQSSAFEQFGAVDASRYHIGDAFLITAGGDLVLKVWSLIDGIILRKFSSQVSPITSVAAVYIRPRIFPRRSRHESVLTDRRDLQRIKEEEVPSPLFSDQVVITSHLDHKVKMWSFLKGSLVHTLEDCLSPITSLILYVPVGTNGVPGGSGSGSSKTSSDSHNIALMNKGQRRDVADTHACSRIIAGDSEGSVYIWQLEHPHTLLQYFRAHSLEIDALCIYRAMSEHIPMLLVTGSRDNTISIWDVDNLSKKPIAKGVMTGHMSGITHVKMFSAGHLDGLLVSCSSDGTLRTMFNCIHHLAKLAQEQSKEQNDNEAEQEDEEGGGGGGSAIKLSKGDKAIRSRGTKIPVTGASIKSRNPSNRSNNGKGREGPTPEQLLRRPSMAPKSNSTGDTTMYKSHEKTCVVS